MAESKPIDRPFTDEIMSRAHKIAQLYTYSIWRDGGCWIGNTDELPFVFGDGETPHDCLSSMLEATAIAVATMLEQARADPAMNLPPLTYPR